MISNQDRILVGHGLENDLRALFLSHPMKMIRDSALFPPFCRRHRNGGGGAKKLKDLVREHLGVRIQDGTHDPAEVC